ncbi:hypothetical protein M419DRAFT_124741 [Trichoderma reesei RUT C-30]|uniref:Uncharacterized protein n=1 Tax=Hypocrea jecorina (strain ATCC 56765 / BCRC 32924 / NRRL 11460 / Rut C-30) TaxID=1344414 RepID=A0A024S0F3_HYPJR|nr:hypothetical protein M419DRAFT_124741 [Trichoderma reesei RUT C-30]
MTLHDASQLRLPRRHIQGKLWKHCGREGERQCHTAATRGYKFRRCRRFHRWSRGSRWFTPNLVLTIRIFAVLRQDEQ